MYGDLQKLTNDQLVIDENDFIWYANNGKINNKNINKNDIGQYITTNNMNSNEEEQTYVNIRDGQGNLTINSKKLEEIDTLWKGWENKSYPEGTTLLKDIISKENKTVTLIPSAPGIGFETLTIGNGVINGQGEDATVKFLPGETRKIPSYIGLLHELIHSDDAINGHYLVTSSYSKNYD